MGLLKDLRFLLILGIFVESQSHVIRSRDSNGLKNSGNVQEVLRTPQKYIIRPVQIATKNSENGQVHLYGTVEFGTENSYNAIESKLEGAHHQVGFQSGDAGDVKVAQKEATKTHQIYVRENQNQIKDVLETKTTGTVSSTEDKLGDLSNDVNETEENAITKETPVYVVNLTPIWETIKNINKNIVDSENSEQETEVNLLKTEITAKHLDNSKDFKHEITPVVGKSPAIQNKPIVRNKDNILETETKLINRTSGLEIHQHFGKTHRQLEEYLNNGKENKPKIPEIETMAEENEETSKKIKIEDQISSSASDSSSIFVKPSSGSIILHKRVPEKEVTEQKPDITSKAAQEIDIKSQKTNVEDKKETQALGPRQVLGIYIESAGDLIESVAETKEIHQKSEEALQEKQTSYEIPSPIKLKYTNEVPEADSKTKPVEYSKKLNTLGEVSKIPDTLEAVVTSIDSENERHLYTGEFNNDKWATAADSGKVIQTEKPETALQLDPIYPADIINSNGETFELEMEDYDEWSRNAFLKGANDKEILGNTDDDTEITTVTAGVIAKSMEQSDNKTLENIAEYPTKTEDEEIPSILPEKDLETSQDSAKVEESISSEDSDGESLIEATPPALELNKFPMTLIQTLGETTEETSIHNDFQKLQETLTVSRDNEESTATNFTIDLELIKSTTTEPKKNHANFETITENSKTTSEKTNKHTEFPSPIPISLETLQLKEKPDNAVQEFSSQSFTETTSNPILNDPKLSTSFEDPSILEQMETCDSKKHNHSSSKTPQAEVKPFKVIIEPVASDSITVASKLSPKPSKPETVSQDSQKIQKTTTPKDVGGKPITEETSTKETPTVLIETLGEISEETSIRGDFPKPHEILTDIRDIEEFTAHNVTIDLKPIKSTTGEVEKQHENSETVEENTETTSDKTNKDTAFPSTILSSLETIQTEIKPDKLNDKSPVHSSTETTQTETTANHILNDPVESTFSASRLEPTQTTEPNTSNHFASENHHEETQSTEIINESIASTSITVPSKQKPVSNKREPLSILSKEKIPSRSTTKRITQPISLNQNEIPNKTTISSGKPNRISTTSKTDVEEPAGKVQGLAKTNRKRLTTTTTTPKPVRVWYINRIFTRNPIRRNPIPPATPPIKKVNGRRTTAPHTISATTAASNQINKQKPSRLQPVTSKPLTNNTLLTRRPGFQTWFSNFPSLRHQFPISFPAIFVNPFTTNNTTTGNQTQNTFGLGLFAVPWKWRPLNFTNLNLFGRNRAIGPTTPPKSDKPKPQNMARDLAFWHGIRDQLVAPKWNSTTGKQESSFLKPWNITKLFMNYAPSIDFFKHPLRTTSNASTVATIPANTQVLHLYVPLKFPFHTQFVQTSAEARMQPQDDDKPSKLPQPGVSDKLQILRSPINPEAQDETESNSEPPQETEKLKTEEKASLMFELELPGPVVKFMKTIMSLMPDMN